MEIGQLHAFSQVVRTGTFRAAAARLHLSQPALWQKVRALQEELGVPLFERAGRRVRVTRAGEQVLERAEALLGAADRLRALAKAISVGQEGVVSIACPAPPIQLVLGRTIGEFARANPHVRLDIRDVSIAGRSPIDALLEGEVDLAVAPRHEALEGFRLFRANVVVVRARKHAWMRRRRIDVRALRDQPLLTPPTGSLSRGLLERACSAAGFEPTIRLANPSPGMLVSLAQNGFGVAVLASDALVGTGLAAAPTLTGADGVLGTDAWLQWRKGAELGPALRRFIDAVRRTAPDRPSRRT